MIVIENTDEVKALIDEFVEFITNDGITVTKISYPNKTIDVATDDDLDMASWYLKHYFQDLKKLGFMVRKPLNIPTLNKLLPQNERLQNKKRKSVKESIDRPYMYFTRHGLGPGTLPSDVVVVDWEDINDYITVIYLDRFLTTKELKDYDIYPETKNNDLMKRYGLYIDDNGKLTKIQND